MAQKNENPYEQKKKKSVEDLTSANEEYNVFVKDMVKSNTKKTASDFIGKEKKENESYYLSISIKNIIVEIASSDKSLNKSLVAEQLLKEALIKRGYIEK